MKYFFLVLSFSFSLSNIYSSQQNHSENLDEIRELIRNPEVSIYSLDTVKARTLINSSCLHQDLKSKLLEKITSLENSIERNFYRATKESLEEKNSLDSLDCFIKKYSSQKFQEEQQEATRNSEEEISKEDLEYNLEQKRQELLYELEKSRKQNVSQEIVFGKTSKSFKKRW